jgi:hypothetical protein
MARTHAWPERMHGSGQLRAGKSQVGAAAEASWRRGPDRHLVAPEARVGAAAGGQPTAWRLSWGLGAATQAWMLAVFLASGERFPLWRGSSRRRSFTKYKKNV